MSKIAFLFPGQGAQSVGMARDFAEAFPSSARTFEQASDVLGWDVAQICFEGPAEELNRTPVSQPAILTTSMAVLAAMKEADFPDVKACKAAAGLSLGEYGALVMAGALEFPDALRLVSRRGQLMEEACVQNPGTMVSVLGLEDDIVEAVCAQAREDGMVVTANYNCPGQVVISGTREGIERAGDLARERGAKRVVQLAVSGAFHSPLMTPAAERLEEELRKAPIASCAIEVVANVSAEPVTGPEDVRRALVCQVNGSVRWRQSVRCLVDKGCTRFVEVGPGKVLTGLMRRIAPECQAVNVSSVEALRAELRV